jgi:hypothetical protein
MVSRLPVRSAKHPTRRSRRPDITVKFTLVVEEEKGLRVTWSNQPDDLDLAVPFSLDCPDWVTKRLVRLLVLRRSVPVTDGSFAHKIPAGIEQPFEAYHTLMAVLRERHHGTITFEGVDDQGNPLNYMPSGAPASVDP